MSFLICYISAFLFESLETLEGKIVICVMLFSGLGIIVANFRNHYKAQRAIGWPGVTGKVLESFVNKEDGMYKPEIRYEYRAYGEYHIADCWRLGATASSWGKASSKRAVAKYPAGASVTVFFNPERPREAVLEPGQTDWSPAIFGALFFVIPVIVLIQISR